MVRRRSSCLKARMRAAFAPESSGRRAARVPAEGEPAPLAHDERNLPCIEERTADDERLGRHALARALDELVEEPAPCVEIRSVEVRGQQVGLQPALGRHVLPAVVVHHEQLRLVQAQVVLGIGVVPAGERRGGGNGGGYYRRSRRGQR